MTSKPSFHANQSSQERYDMLRGHAATMDDASAQLVGIVAGFNAAVADNPCGIHLRYSSPELDGNLRGVPEALLVEMVTLVGAALSATGTPVGIRLEPYRVLYFGEGHRRGTVPFSCVDVVERVWAEFAHRARGISFSQAAQRFAKAFWLRRNQAGASVGNCVVLQCGASVDRFWGAPRYGHTTRDSIRDRFTALAECLPLVDATVDKAALEEEIRVALDELERCNWVPAPDVRLQVGGIGVRLFQTSVKYHVPVALAEALNLFVSEHAAGYLAGDGYVAAA